MTFVSVFRFRILFRSNCRLASYVHFILSTLDWVKTYITSYSPPNWFITWYFSLFYQMAKWPKWSREILWHVKCWLFKFKYRMYQTRFFWGFFSFVLVSLVPEDFKLWVIDKTLLSYLTRFVRFVCLFGHVPPALLHWPGIILATGSINEMWLYNVASYLIGWTHTKGEPRLTLWLSQCLWCDRDE